MYFLVIRVLKIGVAEKRIKGGNFVLLCMSILFYTVGEKQWVLILISSVLFNYATARIIDSGIRQGNSVMKKAGLAASVLSNLAVLFFFKYAAFFTENVEWLVKSLSFSSWSDIPHYQIALPLGISFYTFQSMSYNIDVYRGDVKATTSVINFSCYVTMFSQLVAGPIIRYTEINKQLKIRFVTPPMFFYGMKRFIWGLSKKVLIANTLSIPVDQIFSLPQDQLTVTLAWAGAVWYSLQIYFDFSGYSDMAIGIGRMFGFHFPENFNYPYISRSIQDFWRRWHISLSTWFRDYLYFPLGGSRKSRHRTYLNLMIVFFLCGLWHGAAWTFIIWGLYHGSFLIFERLGPGIYLQKKNRFIGYIYAIPVIVVGWVIFRTDNLSQTAGYIAAMAGLSSVSAQPSIGLSMFLTTDVISASIAGILLSMPVYPFIEKQYIRIQGTIKKNDFAEVLMGGLRYAIFFSFFLYAAILIASGRENPFIYFRF